MLKKLRKGERNERFFKIWQMVLLLIAYGIIATVTAAIALTQGASGWPSWPAGLLTSFPLTPLLQLLKIIFQTAGQFG